MRMRITAERVSTLAMDPVMKNSVVACVFAMLNADAIVPIKADINGDGNIGKTSSGPCVSTTFSDHDDFTKIETSMGAGLPGAT